MKKSIIIIFLYSIGISVHGATYYAFVDPTGTASYTVPTPVTATANGLGTTYFTVAGARTTIPGYPNPTFPASSACFKTVYEAMHRIFETPITPCGNTFAPSTCTYFVDTDNDDIVIFVKAGTYVFGNPVSSRIRTSTNSGFVPNTAGSTADGIVHSGTANHHIEIRAVGGTVIWDAQFLIAASGQENRVTSIFSLDANVTAAHDNLATNFLEYVDIIGMFHLRNNINDGISNADQSGVGIARLRQSGAGG